MGQFLVMFVSSSVNSEIFQHYLSILKFSLTLKKDIKEENII